MTPEDNLQLAFTLAQMMRKARNVRDLCVGYHQTVRYLERGMKGYSYFSRECIVVAYEMMSDRVRELSPSSGPALIPPLPPPSPQECGCFDG